MLRFYLLCVSLLFNHQFITCSESSKNESSKQEENTEPDPTELMNNANKEYQQHLESLMNLQKKIATLEKCEHPNKNKIAKLNMQLEKGKSLLDEIEKRMESSLRNWREKVWNKDHPKIRQEHM